MNGKTETLTDACLAGSAFIASAFLDHVDEITRITLNVVGIILIVIRIVKLFRDWQHKGDAA